MKPVFVKTSNYERFQDGLRVVEGRGAMEASMMLVMGHPGYGKSETVERWSIQTGAVHLRAQEGWTRYAFISALAEELKLDSSGYFNDIKPRVIGYLGHHPTTTLVVDEVDHCMDNSASVLEVIRDITDITEIIVVLVGMEKTQSKISKYPQIMRRISNVVTFHAATPDDVRLICQQKCEVRVAEDLVMEIHRQSRGLISEIVNSIKIIERHAALNGIDAVSLSDMGSQRLTLYWQEPKSRSTLAMGGN